MTTNKETRPFDLSAARAGAPVQTVDGRKVEILKWDARGMFSLAGIATDSHADWIYMWSDNGKWAAADKKENAMDLVMAPLFHIDGKGVFFGDEIENTGGVKFKVDASFVGVQENRFRWPKAAPVVQTRMTAEEVSCGAEEWEYYKGEPTDAGWLSIANTVIGRSIFDGDVVPTSKVDLMISTVAEHVCHACAVETGENTSGVDLNRIINYVKQRMK